MVYKKYSLLYGLICCLLLFGCQREIDLNLPDYQSKLVIEGTIENGSPAMVMLSKSIPYFSEVNLGTLMNDVLVNGTQARVFVTSETGESEELFSHPAHPYTRALLDAAPSSDPLLRDRARVALVGEVGEAVPAGACSLFPRCPVATEACLRFENRMTEVPGRPGHLSACLRGMDKG